MGFCRECGQELREQDYRCPECGTIANPSRNSEEKGNIIFFFIGLCAPIIGIILVLVMNNNRPKDARYALIGSVVMIPMIIVLGIVAAFVIPATGQIISNTQRDSVYSDALHLENTAQIMCADTVCDLGTEFTYADILEFDHVYLDSDYYDFTNNDGVIVRLTLEGWEVDLEAKGTGNWEFIQGEVPSKASRDQVVEDVD